MQYIVTWKEWIVRVEEFGESHKRFDNLDEALDFLGLIHEVGRSVDPKLWTATEIEYTVDAKVTLKE